MRPGGFLQLPESIAAQGGNKDVALRGWGWVLQHSTRLVMSDLVEQPLHSGITAPCLSPPQGVSSSSTAVTSLLLNSYCGHVIWLHHALRSDAGSNLAIEKTPPCGITKSFVWTPLCF